MKQRSFTLTLAALLTGCTVGPDYKKPVMAVSDQWLEPSSVGPVDTAWWNSFGDPTLSRLVEQAVASSPDLRQASFRVAEARANRDVAVGGRYPQVDAKGSATRELVSENGQLPVGNIPGFDRNFRLFDLGFDASWELDLWGRNRRQVEGASARMEAAEWSRRDVMVTLIAELARNYVDLRAAQAKEALAMQELDSNAALSDLTGLRFRAGEASRADADQAASQRASSGAALEQSRAEVVAAAYRVATLVGVPPEQLVPALTSTAAPIPAPPATIASGVRSELLLRRPDIRRAERELAGATADIGVATADLFPRFSLLGSFGQQARQPGDLLSSASTRFSIGPSFSWPIFSGGTIRAQIRATDARAAAAQARYEKAVVTALADSESAANRFARTAAAARATEAALATERNAFQLAGLRAARGEDDRLALERSRLRVVQAERALKEALAAYANAAAALYKALGGGWEQTAQPAQ